MCCSGTSEELKRCLGQWMVIVRPSAVEQRLKDFDPTTPEEPEPCTQSTKAGKQVLSAAKSRGRKHFECETACVHISFLSLRSFLLSSLFSFLPPLTFLLWSFLTFWFSSLICFFVSPCCSPRSSPCSPPCFPSFFSCYPSSSYWWCQER